jgi:hypothetical protein
MIARLSQLCLLSVMGFLYVFALSSASVSTLHAEPNTQAESQAESTPHVAPTADQAQTQAQTQAQADEKAQADVAKEQRLEDLRYKHLWIAYSLIWLIIFGFIRNTWKRSEAVSDRLDELKGRLKRLEDQQHSQD